MKLYIVLYDWKMNSRSSCDSIAGIFDSLEKAKVAEERLKGYSVEIEEIELNKFEDEEEYE